MREMTTCLSLENEFANIPFPVFYTLQDLTRQDVVYVACPYQKPISCNGKRMASLTMRTLTRCIVMLDKECLEVVQKSSVRNAVPASV